MNENWKRSRKLRSMWYIIRYFARVLIRVTAMNSPLNAVCCRAKNAQKIGCVINLHGYPYSRSFGIVLLKKKVSDPVQEIVHSYLYLIIILKSAFFDLMPNLLNFVEAHPLT